MLIKRRSVLQGIAGLACTPMFLKGLAAEAASANDTIVVVVGLDGGNDGLNTVIPLQQYGTYSTLRTPSQGGGQSIAFSEASLAAMAFNATPTAQAAEATQFAFAPTMGPMRQLYATGKLAVVAGIGLPYTEIAALSHFNAWNDWQTGQININEGALPSGWLGAALAPFPPGPLGSAAATVVGARVIATGSNPGFVVEHTPSFNIFAPPDNPYFLLGDAFDRVVNLPPRNAVEALDRAVTDTTVDATGEMQAFAKLAGDYPAPSSSLGWQLLTIAQLIAGGAGFRGYAAVDTGYDFHSSQNRGYPTHPIMLGNLSTAIYQFYTWLKKKNLSSNVVLVTISDFGRTPNANLSFGTDHGAASVAFVLGDRVKGGVYGNYPSLTNFDVNGNLVVHIDFRNMLSDIILAMGGNPTTVVGSTYPRIGFI